MTSSGKRNTTGQEGLNHLTIVYFESDVELYAQLTQKVEFSVITDKFKQNEA